ncbi:MAG: hypothetical protein CO189_10960 [candidate division Zixibacteria bacterium CG_4_9_14_3_um_filter_46_8]|nr:MAG: hypothetical protein CO189_10960 [candidate division Zixibacteria bacterium CG_4_9_14_3_um_filter_46_8]
MTYHIGNRLAIALGCLTQFAGSIDLSFASPKSGKGWVKSPTLTNIINGIQHKSYFLYHAN